MTTNLTNRAIRTIIQDEGKTLGQGSIVQVINIKRIPGANGMSDRYRAIISDGSEYCQGMIASQAVTLFQEGQVLENSVIRVNDYAKNLIKNKTVVILLNIESLSHHDVRIGSPVEVDESALGQPQQQQPSQVNSMYQNINANNNNNARPNNPSTQAPQAGNGNPYGGNNNNVYNRPQGNAYNPSIVRSHAPVDSQHYTLIKDLNMYMQRWTIKARVTSKSQIKTWSNARGEGQLFSLTILDSSDTDIRCTFFKEAVDSFYNMLDEGNVYTFSGGRMKVANSQWNTCKSMHEITFDNKAEIKQASNDNSIKSQNFEFVKIDKLEGIEPGNNVDVIAIVKSCGMPGTIVSKKSGKELNKCDLVIVDDSNVEISLTIWGDKSMTANNDYAGNPVVAFKNLKVGDFGGRSLSTGFDASIMINPAGFNEVMQLQQWWESSGQNGGTKSLSSISGGKNAAVPFEDRKTILSIKEEGLGHNEKPDWISVKCTFNFIKRDKDGGPWYTACPNPEDPCKQRVKVTQSADGSFHCERCGRDYQEPMRRFIFSATVTDDTATTWVSLFDDQARTLLEDKITADEMYNQCFNENFDPDTFESYFAAAQFTEWAVKLKVKKEMVGDDERVKSTIASLTNLDYVQESKSLLKAIDAMA